MGEVAVDVNLRLNEFSDGGKRYKETYFTGILPEVSFPATLEVVRATAETDAPPETWLPITESRNGDMLSSVFHLLSSGLGFQALLLPVSLASLGWIWGIICLSLAFLWQLYTIWLLVHLHESSSGTRYSRFLHLSITAFGERLGKVLGVFPVMYLSGGSSVVLIIIGGGAMKLFYATICGDGATCHTMSINGVEWFLVFTCVAMVIAQLPNLHSMARLSMIGAITAVGYLTLIWALSVRNVGPAGTIYRRPVAGKSDVERFSDVSNAIGFIALSFRGHNLVLEIQGTLPTNERKPSHKTMWRAVTISYLLIALCLFSLAIAGFWAYGIKVPAAQGGLLLAFSKHKPSKHILALIYLLVALNSLSSFQIYAMPVFDNLEMRYITMKNHKCPTRVRVVFRVLFGGLAFFIAVAFPFLGSLGGIIGGLALPLTYAYPCFMWIAIKKPRPNEAMWYLNLVLGCLGVVCSVLIVIGALWTMVDKGLDANFFRPHS